MIEEVRQVSKKKFNKQNMTRNQDSLSELANEIYNSGKMNKATYDSINKISEGPTKENILAIAEIVKDDAKIPEKDKNELIEKIQNDYIRLFNFNNCPEDYKSLKKEVKFFSGMLKYNFYLLAHRLIKVRNGQLYKNDGYNNFKEFIENELNVSKATVYKYMDIISSFGVSLARLDLENDDVEYTKLIPIIPLLKAKDDKIPKDDIKNKFLNDIKKKTREELRKEARKLKIRYGIINDDRNFSTFTKIVDNFYKKIPNNPDKEDIEALKKLILKIKSVIGT